MALQAALKVLLELLVSSATSEEPKEAVNNEVILKEANKTLETIKREWPSFASGIKMNITKDLQGNITGIQYSSDDPVMSYLEYGTGIYGVRKTKITPKNAKALHFKDVSIAAALGFPTEDVFLKSVKGIRPRFTFTRAIVDLGKKLDWKSYTDRAKSGA
uniref:Uncharacterized protein n=1 Tax=viral metagenome TaxID=1070528 RepID=A0A6M3LX94_9ZZZZ